MAKRLPARIEALFVEAERRFRMFGNDYQNDITRAWIGLGMPSHYKPAVQAGLMRALNGRETRGCLSWYLLTDAGVALFHERAAASTDPVPESGPIYQLMPY